VSNKDTLVNFRLFLALLDGERVKRFQNGDIIGLAIMKIDRQERNAIR